MHQAWHSSNDQCRRCSARPALAAVGVEVHVESPSRIHVEFVHWREMTSHRLSCARTVHRRSPCIARQAIDRRVFVISAAAAAAADLHHGVRNHPLLLAHRNDEPPHRTIEQLFHVSCSFFVEAMAAAVTVNFDRLTFTSSSHCHLDFYRLRHCQGRSRRRTRLSHLHWIHLFRR